MREKQIIKKRNVNTDRDFKMSQDWKSKEATELLIQNGKTLYSPAIMEGVEWSTERSGAPGKLTFKILDEPKLKVTEGNLVKFKYKRWCVFYGFVFTRSISSEGVITVTAYDQLRYLKNKDTYVYSNKTLTQVIKMIAKDFQLKSGTMENTGYKIPSRVEDSQTLFDIIGNAHDLTLMNRGEMYVLYDDYGELALNNISNLKVNIQIDEETGQSYEYSSSIDTDTYNQIKLFRDNKDSGAREIYIARSGKNINSWGLLQYYEKLEDGENGKAKVNALLKLYNAKEKKLSIKKAIGDLRVRAGSMVVISLKIDNTKILQYMLVEKCTHTYSDNEHWMDLTLRGGDFNA